LKYKLMFYSISKKYSLSDHHKIKINDENYLFVSDTNFYKAHFEGDKVISLVIGTPLYQGLPLKEILPVVTNHFFEHKLKEKELQGNYIFIFLTDDQITILQDAGKQISLFYDKQTKSLSNSLLQLI